MDIREKLTFLGINLYRLHVPEKNNGIISIYIYIWEL